jgi:peroxiredoxin
MVRPSRPAPLTDTTQLESGNAFPALTLTTAVGELALPEALSDDFGVVLFNRGAWCPYCVAQLRSFQRAEPKLAEVGAKVVALWVDDEATTKEFVEKNKIQFPIGYGVDAAAVAAVTGAFVNPDPAYLQSTGFVLDPSGKVLVSVYSSGVKHEPGERADGAHGGQDRVAEAGRVRAGDYRHMPNRARCTASIAASVPITSTCAALRRPKR